MGIAERNHLDQVIYTKNSWHDDCADKLLHDEQLNDELRMLLKSALWRMECPLGTSAAHDFHIKDATLLTRYLMDIGECILKQALISNLTESMMGERSDEL